jgi:anti-sigma regulatory factor (Ser/Thr protein kinase)
MTSASHWPFRSYLELGALPGAAPHARRHTSQVLRKWDLSEFGETAELVVSELITNAIRASRPAGGGNCVRLWLFSDGARVVIQVWDNCPDPPQPAHAASTDEDGRGLLLVEAMTASWDFYSRDGGKIVWAALRRFSPLLILKKTRNCSGFCRGRRKIPGQTVPVLRFEERATLEAFDVAATPELPGSWMPKTNGQATHWASRHGWPRQTVIREAELSAPYG